MRKLSTYIEYTLMTQHYVFVPGIGGFLLRDINASYSNHIYTPSHREVHFNRFLTKDDGMLANAYMMAESISYDEAISQIRIEVAGIKSALEKKKSVELGALGTLSLDSDHHLMMKNAKHFPLDPDCYGLSLLDIRPWREVEESRKQKALQKTHVSNQEYISIPTVWLRRAVAVAIIVMCFFANFNSSDLGSHTDYATMFNADILFGNAMPQTITNNSWDSSWEEEAVLAEIESSAINEKVQQEAEDAATTAETPMPEKLYYIIIASCTSRTEAEHAVKNRQKQGYENIGILEKDGRFRLFLNSFTTRTEGESQLQQVRENTPFTNAWLLPAKTNQ